MNTNIDIDIFKDSSYNNCMEEMKKHDYLQCMSPPLSYPKGSFLTCDSPLFQQPHSNHSFGTYASSFNRKIPIWNN